MLLPLMGPADDLHLLLTRRTMDVSTHKGQVAFPGGHVDAADADATATALREAEEEVGLPPSAVRPLGLLDDLPSYTNKTIVTPVVGRVSAELALSDLTADPSEVDRVFAVPLAELQRRERWDVREEPWHGIRSTVYSFRTDEGESLWGLSAIFTLMLLAELPTPPPLVLPPDMVTSAARLGSLAEANRVDAA